MRVLGIDPGSQITGYGVLDAAEEITVVTMGVLRAPRGDPLPQRLLYLHGLLLDLLASLDPDEVAIEEPFFARNVHSAFVVGEVRGIALLAAAAKGLPVYQYPPARVREAVAGSGSADKDQVARMLSLQLSVPPSAEGGPSSDATDALAVALCHVLHRRPPHHHLLSR